MIRSIMDMLPKMETMRKNGLIRGEKTGFFCLDQLYSVKQGTYTIIYSEPTHGKSEFSFEICVNQAESIGKRCLICSPETGTVDEIIAELIHKITGKKIQKNEFQHTTDLEFMTAMEWLNEYFLIVDTDEKTYSVQALFDMADEWEKKSPGKKIDIIVGEPYNELDHSDMAKYGARQDLYIEDLISLIRRLCRKGNRHFILTVHPSGSATPITDKHGYAYYPKPLPRQAAGGQALYRKAMTWITLWRPPKNYKNRDKDPDPVFENEVHVHIDKAKPKGVSVKGMCKLYFDWQKNRYVERLSNIECYAFDHTKEMKVLQGNSIAALFGEPINQQSEMFVIPTQASDDDPF